VQTDAVPIAGGGRLLLRRGGAAEKTDLHVADSVAPVAIPSGRSIDSLDAVGAVWRRVWSLAERLVVEFVGVVAVEVREHDRTVAFDRPLPASLQDHLVLDHVLPLMLARRGDLILHAGLVSHLGRAVVLAGASGAGKSTLVTCCAQRGWTVGGDDGVVLRNGPPWAVESTYAGIRLTADSHQLLGLRAGHGPEVAGKRAVSATTTGAFLQAPLPLAAVVVVEPVTVAHPELIPLRGVDAHAALFRATFRSDLADIGSLNAIVDRLADVIESVPVGRLTVPRGRAGLASAEQLLRREVAA
jgi:hypothetical protein